MANKHNKEGSQASELIAAYLSGKKPKPTKKILKQTERAIKELKGPKAASSVSLIAQRANREHCRKERKNLRSVGLILAAAILKKD